MIRNRAKFIIHFITVAFTTCSSFFENFLLFNNFNIEILGIFFIIQSSIILGSSFVNFRITEVIQILFSKKNINIFERKKIFSELYAFYLIVLISYLPLGLIIIFLLRQTFLENIFVYLPSILILLITTIFNQLSGFWFAIQYHNNQSEKISFYQTSKKFLSLIQISFLCIINPTENIVFILSLLYFLNSLIFYSYELVNVLKFLDKNTLTSLKRPINTFKKYIFDQSDISLALKTGYFRTLFSSWAKNGDITIAAIVAGPVGSAILKAVKSFTNLIYQFTSYTQPFFMTYISKKSEEKGNILDYLNKRSLTLLPFALLFSIISYFVSNNIFKFVYKIDLSNTELIIISLLIFIAFSVLISSWSFPLHLLKNKYKLTMLISFLGTTTTYIFFGYSFYSNSLLPLYFALPIGRLTGNFLSLIMHFKERK